MLLGSTVTDVAHSPVFCVPLVPTRVDEAVMEGVISVLEAFRLPMVAFCTVAVAIAAVEVALRVAVFTVVKFPVTAVSVVTRMTEAKTPEMLPARAAITVSTVRRGYGVVWCQTYGDLVSWLEYSSFRISRTI